MSTTLSSPAPSALRRLGISAALLVSAAGLALLAGCSGDGTGDPADQAGDPGKPTQQVTVPAVEGDVAQADFCGLYAKIYCAANAGCCTDAARKAESEAACVAQARCPEIYAGQAGVAYDAKAAGDFLRAQAKAASSCGKAPSSGAFAFVAGTGAEGAACQLGSDAPQCALGLECSAPDGTSKATSAQGVCAARPSKALAADGAACEDGGDCSSGRCSNGACAARAAEGAACSDATDCESERCVGGACASAASGYCSPEAEPTPSNTDWKQPTESCIEAHSSSGSGTSGDITLAFLYSGTWYPCTIKGGLKDGEKRCCTPQVGVGTGASQSSSDGDMYVQMTSGDGLRFTRITVTKGSSVQVRKTYRDSSAVSCAGCNGGYDCESCWVDADGHNDCKVVQVPMSGGSVTWCENYLANSDFF